MTQNNPIRVVVLADSPEVRANLQAIIASSPAFEWVDSPNEIPDVCVVDMTSAGGDAPAEEPGGERDPPATVFLTDEVDGDWAREALRGTATAILTRDATPAEIVAAIEAVAAGLVALSPEVAVLFSGQEPLRHVASATPIEALTPREIEVLAMLAEGLSNKEIARQLDISDNTVKFHLSAIFGKLGAASRTEAVMLGMRQGWILV